MEARIVDVASPARRFAHGEALVRQGEVPDCLFLVRVGVVRLAAALPTGHEVVVGMLGPGDVFGECALLGDPSPVEARAASSLVQVEALPLTALQAVLERSPGTATELLRLLASRLHRTTGALEEALAQDVPTRLCRTLCELARRHGVRHGRGVRLALPITQEDLGRMIGASRETVNRTLATLSARKLIRTEGRRYVIPDVDALARATDREAKTTA
ncbi:MAG TPA: Crp/Fnr family transcriptional regulator [Actinomycetota bacterium]|nr:Crp/Fnr family transcriptional regulator [Actinomycetota bacterium]